MGDDVSGADYSREDRRRYREKVRRCLDVFERMLAERSFDVDRQLTGLEIELNLIGNDLQPSMNNASVLASVADPAFQTELGRYNIELNVPPRALPGDTLFELQSTLRTSLDHAEAKANEAGASTVMVGILPTLMPEHLSAEWMSANPRYAALNEAIFAARREDLELNISGSSESLRMDATNIGPESACTSVQLHLQVSPADFAAHWNAAQALAGPQLALAANSPYLFGRRLWDETRTELFLQATDTRSPELRNQGVRPRVFFGERWITSIFDLFEENVRYFPALLPEMTDEDPLAVLEQGGAPKLQELRLHNGTVYRWNRPVYDIADERPHLRVENRVLPAGPTVADVVANAAFFYGCIRMLAAEERPVWSRMTFGTAHSNFLVGSRRGVESTFYWPGCGEISWDELVLRHLLPMAADGLASWGVASAASDHFLTIIEERCKTGRNGAWWQVRTVEAFETRGLGRREALHEMLRLYLRGMHSNQPVHTWEVPSG
jgi:hypothetical protein